MREKWVDWMLEGDGIVDGVAKEPSRKLVEEWLCRCLHEHGHKNSKKHMDETRVSMVLMLLFYREINQLRFSLMTLANPIQSVSSIKLKKSHNSCVCISTIVVKQTSHGAVSIIALKHFRDAYHTTVQVASILPGRIFAGNKTNPTSIRAIIVDGVT
jgi:hypothetical protein